MGVTSVKCYDTRPPSFILRPDVILSSWRGKLIFVGRLCFVPLYHDWYHFLLRRPMGQIEQGAGCATKPCPIYSLHVVEVGRTEVKTSAVEDDGSSTFVDLPKSSTVCALLTRSQHVSVQIDVTELQHAVSINDEFLKHLIWFSKSSHAENPRFVLYFQNSLSMKSYRFSICSSAFTVVLTSIWSTGATDLPLVDGHSTSPKPLGLPVFTKLA